MYMTILLENGKYADLPPELDPSGELVYGNAAVYYLEPLSVLAAALGLKDLQSFIVEDPEDYAEALEGLAAEGAQEVLADVQRRAAEAQQQAQWYPPAEALPTVRGLIAHLTTHPEAAASQPDPSFAANREAVLWDLRAYEQILEEAQQQGLRFNFSAG
jgi:hypothetical protein